MYFSEGPVEGWFQGFELVSMRQILELYSGSVSENNP